MLPVSVLLLSIGGAATLGPLGLLPPANRTAHEVVLSFCVEH